MIFVTPGAHTIPLRTAVDGTLAAAPEAVDRVYRLTNMLRLCTCWAASH